MMKSPGGASAAEKLLLWPRVHPCASLPPAQAAKRCLCRLNCCLSLLIIRLSAGVQSAFISARRSGEEMAGYGEARPLHQQPVRRSFVDIPVLTVRVCAECVCVCVCRVCASCGGSLQTCSCLGGEIQR